MSYEYTNDNYESIRIYESEFGKLYSFDSYIRIKFVIPSLHLIYH